MDDLEQVTYYVGVDGSVNEIIEEILNNLDYQGKLIHIFTNNGQQFWYTIGQNLAQAWQQIEDDLGQGVQNIDEYLNRVRDSIIQATEIVVGEPFDTSVLRLHGNGNLPYWCRNETLCDEYNLNRYQIFTENQMKIKEKRSMFNDNCFVFACRQSEVFTPEEMVHIKKTCCHRQHITTKVASSICKELGVKMVMKYYLDNGTQHVSYHGDGSSNRTFVIAHHCRHWFVFDSDVKFSSSIGIPKSLHKITSLYLVRHLIKNGYMIPMTLSDKLMVTNQFANNKYEFGELTLNPCDMKYYRPFAASCTNDDCENFNKPISDKNCPLCDKAPTKKPKEQPTITWFCDFETYTRREQVRGKLITHLLPYLVAGVSEKGHQMYESRISYSVDNMPGWDSCKMWEAFINRMYRGSYGKPNDVFRLYFHNLKFDFCQILECLQGKNKITKILKKGGTVYQVNMYYNCTGYTTGDGVNKVKHPGGKIKLDIRCSYLLIGQGLQKASETYLGKKLKSPCLYNWYNEHNIWDESGTPRKWIPISELERYDGYSDFLDYVRVHEPKLLRNECVDMLRYYHKYCILDCEVLRDVFHEFSVVYEKLGIIAKDGLTISSLANRYYYDHGAYDDVYELSGIPQIFCQKAVVGGRCMTAWNRSYHVTRKTDDFDACSLYPSAMKWIPVGKPRLLDPFNYGEFDFFIAEVKINKVGKCRPFPILSYLDEDGRNFENDEMVGMTIVVDSITLEDFVEFQHGEYDIIQGYGWDNKSTIIDSVTETIYQERLKYKELSKSNPSMTAIQETYKTIMNSAYGKNIMKMSDSETVIKTDEDIGSYVDNNYANIRCGETVAGFHIVEKYKEKNDHWNRPHVGACILAQSKRQMNRVMCLADDLGVNIYYTDTDSLQIDSEGLNQKLIPAFREKYGYELVGDQRGQFHCDFTLTDKDGKKVKNPYSVEGLYLGKKMYACRLRNDDGVEGYHLVMKGIPSDLVEFEHFTRLASGETINYDILKSKSANIRTTCFTSIIPSSFERNIKAKCNDLELI